MGRLKEKVAIVTGAAGSLGLAGVRAMAAEGARMVRDWSRRLPRHNLPAT